MTTDRIKEILSWYKSESPAIQGNLYRMLMTGRLAGTGKLVILPVDQGFEHGPARTFAPNASGYDPRYHFELALEAGCNAYAAPKGQMEVAVGDYAGRIPTILKLNNSDSLQSSEDPCPAITSSVKDAVYMGCSAVGFTIYPGSAHRNTMYGQIQEIAAEAKAAGLLTVVWSYPRGSGLSKKGETATDVVAYAAHIAAQLGAQIVKVKPPHDGLEQEAARKVYEQQGIKIDTLEDRIRHVVQSTFNGRRVVIFSGGASKSEAEVLDEIRGIHAGGGFGSIMGRNAFQRSKADALSLLGKVQDVFMT